MRRLRTLPALILAAGLFGCAELPPEAPPIAPPPAPAPAPGVPPAGPVATDPQITNALVELVENKDRYKVDLTNAQGTPVGDILVLGTPTGYTLRNRYLSIGVPLSEALSRNTDPVFRQKLVELARWEKDGETRAAALIAVARARDPKDLVIINEALINLDPAVRFGALGALQVWGNADKSIPLLALASERDTEPILRVYAAAAMSRMGSADGLARLRAFLDNPSWLVRAMAGRYLGDYGTGDDYDELVKRIGREQTNDFVVAEYCIAALKLFPKKNP